MNTHCLVIGGTRGLGREVVKIFSKKGHTVSVIGRSAPSEDDKNLAGVSYWAADLLDAAARTTALTNVIEKNGKLDNLVFLQRFKGQNDKWTGEIDATLTVTKEVTERLAGEFVPTGGAIVIVSSIFDQFVADNQQVGYSVAKAGIFQMAKHYAVVLGPKGIRVNCVSPCTFIKDENEAFYTKNEKLMTLFRQCIPLGRMGHAVDSANAIAFLCSPEAAFITGQRITVDGGVSLISQEALARKVAGI